MNNNKKWHQITTNLLINNKLNKTQFKNEVYQNLGQKIAKNYLQIGISKTFKMRLITLTSETKE